MTEKDKNLHTLSPNTSRDDLTTALSSEPEVITFSTISPDRIDTSIRWMELFGNYEKEEVFRYCFIVLKRLGRGWQPFSMDEYNKTVDHEPGWEERDVLNWLLNNAYLLKDSEGRMIPNEERLGMLRSHIKDTTGTTPARRIIEEKNRQYREKTGGNG